MCWSSVIRPSCAACSPTSWTRVQVRCMNRKLIQSETAPVLQIYLLSPLKWLFLGRLLVTDWCRKACFDSGSCDLHVLVQKPQIGAKQYFRHIKGRYLLKPIFIKQHSSRKATKKPVCTKEHWQSVYWWKSPVCWKGFWGSWWVLFRENCQQTVCQDQLAKVFNQEVWHAHSNSVVAMEIYTACHERAVPSGQKRAHQESCSRSTALFWEGGSGRRVFYLDLLDLVCGCKEETVDKGVDFPASALCSLFTGTVWERHGKCAR